MQVLINCLIYYIKEALSALIDSGRYDDRDDFTVVLQPFMEGVELPYKVMSYTCLIIVLFFIGWET